jgi:MoaA/NifB/PqqE/SkfB family radical SAM enzyme
MKKKCMDMIENYFLDKRHRVYDGIKWRYKYSSNAGKFGMSNLLMEGLVLECSGSEVKLMVAIISRVKRSDNVFNSGCVHLVSNEYGEICSRPVFCEAIRKFMELGYLVATLDSRWFILNPRYVNKFYSLKAPKYVTDNKK